MRSLPLEHVVKVKRIGTRCLLFTELAVARSCHQKSRSKSRSRSRSKKGTELVPDAATLKPVGTG